ncbi:MAG TPA: PQQ-binding-like beta-propeller repeat protein, partial [Pyrinomonadaceae bacterium]|jgi:outer membrane protein assembly factor BamB|nr:PQQ-binding-like beta-propeller repeat protein [Pyrinomonadaceae bacterium]
MKQVRITLPVLLLFFIFTNSINAQSWTAKLDKDIRFYQTTEMGVVVAGTEKSLYALDGSTGESLWRRKDVALDETDVAPVPGTDLLLLSFQKGDKTRVEAVDVLTGDLIWRSDKIKGALMQMAVDTDTNLLAVVLVKDAKERPKEGFKRHPLIHVLDLSSGNELWKYEASEVEMMPTRWPTDDGKEVEYALDNYYPPVFVDGRLYLFYDGVTSFDARGGKERLRERYRVNEGGLALTEAEPIFAESVIYSSGRGHLRAVSRQTGDTIWEAKDLGLTPEMLLVDNVLYVRTGGLFTRLKDGEIAERGPFGVSAIDARNGKVLWSYKGADKGITNLLLPDASTIAIADRDDLIFINPQTGKRTSRVPHRVERASFGILNENGDIVIGGQSEVAAFDRSGGRELWRARHTPPGRGIFRTITAIVARAASLYFRFGGTAMTAMRGVQIARAVSSASWSGLAARSSFSNLQSLATTSARNYGTSRFRQFGIVSRVRSSSSGASFGVGTLTRKRTVNLEDRLLDRLDPSHQLERLSRYLWHKDRLAALRGNWMYFYTDLRRQSGHGLAGVNVNNGRPDREIRVGELDERFITDEVLGLMYSSDGNRVVAQPLR